MSRTESSMVELGTVAPAFELVDVRTGKAMGRDDVFAMSWDESATDQFNRMPGGGTSRTGRHGLLVMFVCVHCPYVQHVEEELGRLGRDYFNEGEGPIAMAAIRRTGRTECGRRRSGADGHFPTCWTRHRRWRGAMGRRVRRTSFCSMRR